MLTTQTVRRSSRRLAAASQVIESIRSAKKRKLSVSSIALADYAAVHSSRVDEHEEITSTVQLGSASTTAERKGKRRKPVKEPNPADYSRTSNEWKFGAHVSAAGGVENAIVNAAEIGANAFALFLKSQRKWTSSDISDVSASLFKSRLKAFGYDPSHVVPHGNYLINLGNPDAEKRQKSFECFLDDLRRCELLGLKLYNFHPGSTVGLTSTDECISFIAECLNRAHRETKFVITVIENMAGAGNVIGSNFAELTSIIDQVKDKTRVGVCLDTCHAFAAGYDLSTRKGYEATFDEFDKVVGLHYLRAMHLNDSKMPLGSNRDRHENIGLGHLTLDAFAFIARDPRLKNIPLIMETPRSSASDPTGESPAVWRAEIDVLNRLSEACLETKDSQTPLIDGHVTDEFTEDLKDMTRTVETVVGRIAVLNGGGAKQAAKKSKRTKKTKMQAKNEVDKDHDSAACSC